MNELLQEIYDKCLVHDWTHEMSDDHRAWTSGQASLQDIRSLVDQAGEEGSELFSKMASWGWGQTKELPPRPE
jgi:hypothetical protein